MKHTYTSFDELLGDLFEEKQACSNAPIDETVRFEMPDGVVIKHWHVQQRGKKTIVIPSDKAGK